MLLIFLWLLPLFGGVLLWTFGPQLKSWAGPIGAALVGVAFFVACALWGEGSAAGGLHLLLVRWLDGWALGLQLDRLSLVWTLVITGVGFLIHVYAIGYMDGDRAFARFFAYMNFFVFAMLTLVLSDNLIGLLIGWGLVGLASYFLIGFWFERPSAVAAARKAFVMNVIGDAGIMAAVFILVTRVHSIGYAQIFSGGVGLLDGGTPGHPMLFAVCACLFVGCAAKSAQVPLHTWLPDAMEGPTPVSALIHAATMVTAGVYLIARFAPLWSASPGAQELVGVIGALTALWGATLGCVQWDIKRILAYSTMSQIGYMIMGVGVGAFSAGVMHFLTHAFFKAQLFLAAGIVIHGLADEQDVRRMGGLRTRMPFAFAAILIGVLAICGIPGFSGYFSKDDVLYGTLSAGHPWLYAVGVATAGLTAYYMFRLLFVTFFGRYRGDLDPALMGVPAVAAGAGHHAEETPHHHAPSWLMAAPVAVLMVPSVFIGWLDLGEGGPWKSFFRGFPGFDGAAVSASLPDLASTGLVLVVVAAGIAVAFVRYGTAAAQRDAVVRLRDETQRTPPVLVHAYYVDAIYDAVFVRSARAVGGWFVNVVDPHVIDAGVREVAFSAQWLGHLVRSFQTGLVRVYALALTFGVACFVAYYAAAFGAGR